jgi:hypothetical protein
MISLDDIVANPPIVHAGGTTFGISRALCSFLDQHLPPPAVTLETGAGLSTLVILRHGVARDISITPYAEEFEAIRAYCARVGIATHGWEARHRQLHRLAAIGHAAAARPRAH